MAAKKTEPLKQAVVPKYSVEELSQNPQAVLGRDVKSECVVAAFRLKGLSEATVSEAKKIVNEFLNKEVM